MRQAESPSALNLREYADGIQAGDRAVLARAITLIESKKAEHRHAARDLLQRLLPETGKAHRVGVTGVPGVGKSTLVDQLGGNLTAQGHKVAVLAVDPSSIRSGGSILADKTRMRRLGRDPDAFIRPSPAAGTLGGVASRTRETMLLCEAAGFDVVLVETIGIGQSEVAVADMVDFFLVLMLPGAGDELQGLKKGVVEIADMIAVNKADSDNVERAKRAAAEYTAALHILTPGSPNWTVPVITVSGRENIGLDKLWAEIERHREIFAASGELAKKRSRQQVRWMWAMVEDRLKARLAAANAARGTVAEIEAEVGSGQLAATLGADRILALLEK